MLTFTPIESVIAFSDCKGFSAQPEVLKPPQMQAFRVCCYKCTRDAKSTLEKSITYEANFKLMCNCLQENIRISRHTGSASSRPEGGLICHNQLRIKDKTHFLPKATDLQGNTPMVHQLHSFLATRGGSQGSC